MENSSGLMEGNILVIITMIKSMDMECLNGRMEGNIKELGNLESNMGAEFMSELI